VQRGPGSERRVHVVLENHHNEARRLGPKGRTMVAQWNDDFHHPLHILLTGETEGYYADFADKPIDLLGRVLAQGFAYQGEPYGTERKPRGEKSTALPPGAFVNFLQNHDQIGNRPFGDRLAQSTPPEKLRAGLAILLLGPQIPMLYMGEEYGATQPFLYFCNYQGDLAKAITEGRRKEFAGFGAFADEQQRAKIPDANATQTYVASQLDAADRERSPHKEWLEYTKTLLRVRRERIVPLIPQIVAGSGGYHVDGSVLKVDWATVGKGKLILLANFGAETKPVSSPGEIIFSTHEATAEQSMSVWEVRLLVAT
jgi:malto-oligosyltrehalose trehalohydrolase